MIKKYLKVYALPLFFLVFMFSQYISVIPRVEAQGNQNTTTSSSFSVCDLGTNPKLQNLFNYISCIIVKSVIPLIFTLALAFFVWGVTQYVINDAEEAKKAKGKQFMIWGIVGLTVMVSVWGLVALLGNTFNVDTSVIPKLPE